MKKYYKATVTERRTKERKTFWFDDLTSKKSVSDLLRGNGFIVHSVVQFSEKVYREEN